MAVQAEMAVQAYLTMGQADVAQPARVALNFVDLATDLAADMVEPAKVAGGDVSVESVQQVDTAVPKGVATTRPSKQATPVESVQQADAAVPEGVHS